MRVLVVGATGTIGRAVVDALRADHEVIGVSRNEGPARVDITRPDSIRDMYEKIGEVDAVVSCAGGAAWKPLAELTDADFDLSLKYKLMGQVNLVRRGVRYVRGGGSFTLTSGILAQHPMPNSAATSLVNAAIEGFGRAAALELPRGIRINVVSPDWVSETLAAMGQDPAQGVPAAEVARAYVASVTGRDTGTVIPVLSVPVS
jgi:NAD(P)-dependent dehydrogenase (short-subunit alcohol dehydrogenase family)